jgi:hypothetical protein
MPPEQRAVQIGGTYFDMVHYWDSWDSSVSIVTDYGLDDWMIRVWILVETWNFSLQHCAQTGSGAHPASCPVGTGGSFPEGKVAWA